MNEPNKQTALEWVKTDDAIAAAIRATGATNKIIFQGTAWDGAWKWATSGNATEMLKAYDPGNNYAFEAHQYLDRDGSGTSPTCVAGSGAKRLEPFTTWLLTHGLQGIVGEVGWPSFNETTFHRMLVSPFVRSTAVNICVPIGRSASTIVTGLLLVQKLVGHKAAGSCG